MGLSMSKTKSMSGLALISALVAGCGGGGGSSPAPAAVGGPPSGTFTTGSTTCSAISSPETITSSSGALLGSCEQYEASTAPTKAATAFKSPTGTLPVVVYNASTGYDINLPLVSATKTTLVPGNLISSTQENTSFGNFVGVTYGISDSNTGSGARVYDLRNTTKLTLTEKVLDLNSSRFGIFNRFADRTLGYYGGWAEASTQGNLPTGAVTFKGPVVGVIGPSSGNSAVGTPAGYSTTVTIVVNFAASGNQITSLSFDPFGFSANGSSILPQQVASGIAQVSASSLDAAAKALSASFTTSPAGTNSVITAGRLAGSFAGVVGTTATEFVGTIKFTTADGRNAVGAFGTRSGAQTN
jgi:hypothetical protein